MNPTGDFEGVGVFQVVLYLSLTYWLTAWFWRSIGKWRSQFNRFSDYIVSGQIDNLLTVFKVIFAKMLKPRFCKQHNKDLKQNPLAPSLMAYRSTSQPLEFIADCNGSHFSIFSSQGQLNPTSMTFLAELE